MKLGNVIREILMKNNGFVIDVMGNSMDPFLKAGQKVEIRGVENLEIGDIVLYENYEKNLILHRIIYLSNDYFIAKGDNNEFADDIVPKCSIVGKLYIGCFDKVQKKNKPVYKLSFNYTIQGYDKILSYRKILKNVDIQIKSDIIDKNENNILIHSSAKSLLSKVTLSEQKKNVFHFGLKTSNMIKPGFSLLSEFNHIVYVYSPIITGLLDEVQQSFLVIGALNGFEGGRVND